MRKYVAGMCELTITPSLRMAMSLLSERKFDLLISDFIFPEGDALDLIQLSRKSEATKDMPIIVISGSMDGALLSRVLKAGANEGLSKPLATDEFRAVVTRMMSDPYVRSMERAICSVTCFQWAVRGSVSQYCPELNLLFTAATKDEVSKQMLAALQERLTQGADVGYTNHEMVVTHVVQG